MAVRFGQFALVPRTAFQNRDYQQARILKDQMGGEILHLKASQNPSSSYGVGSGVQGVAITRLYESLQKLSTLFGKVASITGNDEEAFAQSGSIGDSLIRNTLQTLLEKPHDPENSGKLLSTLSNNKTPNVDALTPNLTNRPQLQDDLKQAGSALSALFQSLAALNNPQLDTAGKLEADVNQELPLLLEDLAQRIDTFPPPAPAEDVSVKPEVIQYLTRPTVSVKPEVLDYLRQQKP